MGIFDNKPGGIFGNDPDGGILNRKKKDDDADFSDVGSDSSSTAGNRGGMADFSDVTSGSSSDAPATGMGGSQTYTVKSGDSLSKIAKHFYGDGSKWNRIFEANRGKIDNPDLIHPGQEFTIPDA